MNLLFFFLSINDLAFNTSILIELYYAIDSTVLAIACMI